MLRRLNDIFAVCALVLYSGAFLPLLLSSEQIPGEETASNLPGQIAFVFTYIWAIMHLRRGISQVSVLFRRSAVAWFLVAWALLSVCWSYAPDVTLRRGIALIGTSLFALALVVRYDFQGFLRISAWAAFILIAGSLFFVFFLPELGIMSPVGEWRGVFVHKNPLGRICVYVALVIITYGLRYSKRPAFWMGLAVMSGILLLGSKSATGFIVFLALFAFASFFTFLRAIQAEARAFFFTLVLTVGAGVMLVCGLYINEVLAIFGKNTTFTGRTVLWELVWQAIEDHFWVGYGYGGFWQGWNGPSGFIWAVHSWLPPHAHNGFLDIWLDLGVVGLCLFVLLMLVFGIRVYRRMEIAGPGFFTASIFIFLTLYNLMENTSLNRNSLFWVVFVYLLTMNACGTKADLCFGSNPVSKTDG